MPRPFAVIGFTVFITIALLYDMKTGVTAAVLAAYTVALVVTLFIDRTRKSKLLPCISAAGAIACALLLCAEMFTYQPALSYDGSICEIKAVITDECEENYGNYYYEAKAVAVDGEETDLKLRFVFSSAPEAEPYDVIEGNFVLYVLGSSNEEFILSHKANGIFLGAYPQSSDYSVISVPESEKPFAKKIIDFRAAVKNAIYRVLPDERGALAVALILGDKSRVPDDVMCDFNKVGITHIICVSGFHLSLWSFLILKILRKTGMGEKPANALACIGVIGFMLVAGMTYSVMRSGIMMLVYLIANIISRKRDPLNSLGFALTAIAVYNPFAMGAVGLQLSALATLGLILYFQNFGEDVRMFFKKIKPKLLGNALHFICEAVFTTAAATAFILPITLKLNGGFHFGIFLANPAVIPLAQGGIILCALGALVGSIPFSLFNLPTFAGGFLVKLLMAVARKTAELDFLLVKLDSEISNVILFGLAAVVLFSLWMAYLKKPMPKIACILCAVYFTAAMIFVAVSGRNETKIKVVDCGNGTSVILSVDGKNYLFGCGGTEFLGAMYLEDAVDSVGGELEAVILPDESEYNSAFLLDILKFCRPKKIFCGDLPEGSKLLLSRTEILDFEDLYISESIRAESLVVDGSACVILENEDLSALICFDPVFDMAEIRGGYDVIITRNDYPVGTENSGCRLAVINCENARGILLQNELYQKGINCAATGGDGNIIIRAEDGFVSIKREN